MANCPTCGATRPEVVNAAHPTKGDVRTYIWMPKGEGRPHWHCPDPYHSAQTTVPDPNIEKTREFAQLARSEGWEEAAVAILAVCADLETTRAELAEVRGERDDARRQRDNLHRRFIKSKQTVFESDRQRVTAETALESLREKAGELVKRVERLEIPPAENPAGIDSAIHSGVALRDLAEAATALKSELGVSGDG